MNKAFLLISAGMLSYLGTQDITIAQESPDESLPPVSGSSSRSTSNSAGTTINQQTNAQTNNDQFFGFGPGIQCPSPSLGFSFYGGGGAGSSGLDGGVSTSAYGGMITLSVPLGRRNQRSCAQIGEAQIEAVRAQIQRTQLEAAKTLTDIKLVTIQQCINILQTARLSGQFGDACNGVDLVSQQADAPPVASNSAPPAVYPTAPSGAATLPAVKPGSDATPQPSPSMASNPGQPPSRQDIAPTLAAGRLTPQFTSRSQPGQGQIPITLPQPASTPVSPTLLDQLPSIARSIAVSPAIEEVASGRSPQDLPVIAPPSVQASRTVANSTALSSLPSNARVQPASAAVSTPGQREAPLPTTPAEVTASPARSTVAAPTSRVAELPAIARIPLNPTLPDQLPSIARSNASAIEEVASGRSPQDLPVIAPAIEEVASRFSPLFSENN